MAIGIYDPDSDDPSTKLSVLPILKSGHVGDVLLWKNKYLSAGILICFSVIWFLFEIMEYHFITVVCHLLMFFMSVLFIWSNCAALIKRDPPPIDDIRLPESTIRFFFYQINLAVSNLYQISVGSDLITFFVTIISLWILSAFGSLCDTLTLLYIVYMGMATIPALYEKYEEEVDDIAGKSTQNMKYLIQSFNSKVLDRIPRGPTKHKKLA